jgi:hypothetical protein
MVGAEVLTRLLIEYRYCYAARAVRHVVMREVLPLVKDMVPLISFSLTADSRQTYQTD